MVFFHVFSVDSLVVYSLNLNQGLAFNSHSTATAKAMPIWNSFTRDLVVFPIQ